MPFRFGSSEYRILPLTDDAAAYYGASDLTQSDNPSYSVLCIELPEGNYIEAYITEKSPREMVREHEINGETVKAERFFTTIGHVFFDNKLIITAVPGEQIGIGIRSETHVYEGFLPKDSKRGGQYEIKLKYVDLVFDENNVLIGYDDNNKTATVTVNEILFDEYKTIWNAAVS